MTREELIKIGLKKRNGEINVSWQQLADIYNLPSGEYFRDMVKKYVYRNKNDNLTKVLVISDLHIPFHLENILEILNTYQNKVDILLLNGDIADSQSISKYIKKYRVPFVDELIQTREMLLKIINVVKPKEVILNAGNHEYRMIRYFSENLHDDLLSLMPETSLELLIEDGFYKKDRQNGTKIFYEPLKNIINNIKYTHNWYNQIKDVVFCHPSAYKGSILKTAQDAYLYFIQRKFNFNCLVCSHTHAAGIYKYGDCFIIENGSLCKEPDYAREGKLLRPQVNGMFYCVLEDDKFNYDKSKLIILS